MYHASGLVMDDHIECPMHNRRFNFKIGRALRAPVCINLTTLPVRVDGGRVFIGPDADSGNWPPPSGVNKRHCIRKE